MVHAYLEPGLIFIFLPLVSWLKVNSEFQWVEPLNLNKLDPILLNCIFYTMNEYSKKYNM